MPLQAIMHCLRWLYAETCCSHTPQGLVQLLPTVRLSLSGNVAVNSMRKQVGQVCVGLGRATNNVAEYTALIKGLEVRHSFA